MGLTLSEYQLSNLPSQVISTQSPGYTSSYFSPGIKGIDVHSS